MHDDTLDKDAWSSIESIAVAQPAFAFVSLDDVFPELVIRRTDNPANDTATANNTTGMISFSELFDSNTTFRQRLRDSIRADVFGANAEYRGLSEKARQISLTDRQTSIQGTWKRPKQDQEQPIDVSKKRGRSKGTVSHTTRYLQDIFGHDSVSDEFDLLGRIGHLCQTGPEFHDGKSQDDYKSNRDLVHYHFIDIVGVQGRRISHSWHQDTGSSGLLRMDNTTDGAFSSRHHRTYTVLWGFPPTDSYVGCGVFTHVVPLAKEHWSSSRRSLNQPILFASHNDNGNSNSLEDSIVRPMYGKGRELLVYQDVQVLHSAPDVTYRTSVMRFM